jgi:signal transduction histidine kinase
LDGAGTLWIGTSKGISFLQSGAVHVPLGAPNALYGEILGIAESNGWLWITTRDHVLRVRPAALLNQSFGEGDYREFGVAEGLPSTEGVKRSRSVVVDNRGRIWFSLNKGISVLEPSAFARPAFPVMIRLDGMLVDGRTVPSDNFVHIPAGRHRLTFRYDGVNVSNPDGVRYRYRLDNVDDNADPAWSDPTALREIDYTNTPPGQFQFHVMARNPDGLWSGQETIMAFEIEPAYWQTRWFQVGSVLAVLLLFFGLYRFRLRELHREFHAALDARVNERMRIARELHDTLLQSFQGLLLRFQTASNLLPSRAQEAKQKLDNAIDLAAQAITEGRGAVQGLRSSTVVTNDLAVAVSALGKELAADQTNENSPVFRVAEEGEPRDLHPILRDEVYRIAGEALRNAFRHAQANRIEVEIRYDAHHLRIRVRDDGKGIGGQVVDHDGRTGHFGLHGMRERAKIIGGNLEVWSSPQSGTELELTIPARVAYATTTERRSWFSGRGTVAKS